ncbi:Glutamate receptor ionotropic, NMDA 3A [Homalodisca vitripennis]|nr:Glutamate receptor ionotropic, NMDA 3A [Homalodisca vitripennis]
MQRYSVQDVGTGVQHLKNGTLDILIADTPILDYYRATDHGCKLQKIGDAINEDTYAVGMTKGFPLKDSISAVIAKYSSNGYMDILQEKWYGGLPCFKLATDMAQPRPLGVAAVTDNQTSHGYLVRRDVLRGGWGIRTDATPPPACAFNDRSITEQEQCGEASLRILWSIANHIKLFTDADIVNECKLEADNVLFDNRKDIDETIRRIPLSGRVFLLLGMGMIVGCLILLIEHLFYRYTLPILRHKPKGTIWRSRNIMFFSQKLYRFINCVELVSPHHAARELVHTLRQGQITSLFQKSVKRKEHEQRRRRKSKAQFFEMIQEIRRVQQEEKVVNATPPMLTLPEEKSPRLKKPVPSDQNRRHSRSKSSSNLSIRRLSSDINMAAGRFLDCHSSQAIGRRLSRDTNLSPPDINSRRASHLSISRKPSSQLLGPSDVDSSSDLSVPPRSPNTVIQQTSSLRLLQTLPRSPDCSSTSRFRYVDIKSPSFKTKLSRFKEPSDDVNPKVIIHHDNKETTVPNNTQDNGTEHLIEIVIPPGEKKPVPKERLKPPGEMQTSSSLTGLSVLEQISTLAESQTLPLPPPKPKIVSYLPKKHRKLSTDTGHRRVNGKTRKRASSDSILRAEDVKPDVKTVVENCEVFSPSGSSADICGTETSGLSRLSRAELLTLSQIPEQELKRQLLAAIQDRDPT